MMRLADLPRVMVEKKQTGWLVFLILVLAMVWYMDRHAEGVSSFVLTSTGEVKTSLWVALGTSLMFGLFVYDQRKATLQCEARVATLESHLFLKRSTRSLIDSLRTWTAACGSITRRVKAAAAKPTRIQNKPTRFNFVVTGATPWTLSFF